VALLMGTEFRKLSEFTHVFWKVSLASGEGRLFPSHAFKYLYSGGLLHIRSVIPSTSDDGQILKFNNSGYLVSAPSKSTFDKNIEDVKMPDMNSQLICHHFAVADGMQWKFVYSRIDYTMPSEVRNFQFRDHENHVEIIFSDTFIGPVLDSIGRLLTQ
jgi:hypothetical protein